MLTIFCHCGGSAFSSRRAARRTSGNQASTVLAEDFRVTQGFGMLIRSDISGVSAAAEAAPAISAASLPTRLLGGLLLLICP